MNSIPIQSDGEFIRTLLTKALEDRVTYDKRFTDIEGKMHKHELDRAYERGKNFGIGAVGATLATIAGQLIVHLWK